MLNAKAIQLIMYVLSSNITALGVQMQQAQSLHLTMPAALIEPGELAGMSRSVLVLRGCWSVTAPGGGTYYNVCEIQALQGFQKREKSTHHPEWDSAYV